MKRTIPIILSLALLCISCGGKESKKVVDSTVKELVNRAEEKFRSANQSDAVRYLKTKHRIEMAEDIYNNHISPSPCPTCNGYGVVYRIDAYGNAITDAYGNIQFLFCPMCGGSGQIPQ